ncbi:MAG: aldehyde dehydrogenase family protein [Firmicutes bacterium]|nr:aldehyde dehydrogenase family protein [Bacillota bacterium]MCL5013868.1 aldehyde dehydrogenase family protein [Bacillota bacterium]
MTELDMATKWPMYIGGASRTSERVTPVLDPGSGLVVASVPAAAREDALEALSYAQKGTEIAANMPSHQRMRILNQASDLIRARREAFAVLIATEGSKTIREARKEVDRCVDTMHLSAEEARRQEGEVIKFDQSPGSENRVGYWQRGPVGIVLAITPFNDPLNLVAHKVGPAIATGNAVIVKPSELTPLSALKLAETLYEAGLPREVLSVVTGSAHDIGEPLVQDPRVRMVSFTGGLKTGTHIAHQAGLKKISMELGSNSPVIILADAELEAAAKACVSGAFWAAGQNCLGVQRIFIEQGVYDEMKERIVALTAAIRMGEKMDESTDMGPLITSREATRVADWVEHAQSRGARVLIGGERQGTYYRPTILEGVPTGMTVLEEEIFGPVASLVAVKDLDSAIHQANSVNYGLQAGVFTRDISSAFHAIKKLQVGGVMINDSSDYRIDAMPFGGVKGSGLGREGVHFAAEAMTEQKVVCFNL